VPQALIFIVGRGRLPADSFCTSGVKSCGGLQTQPRGAMQTRLAAQKPLKQGCVNGASDLEQCTERHLIPALSDPSGPDMSWQQPI
jgi:hypothetical protein